MVSDIRENALFDIWALPPPNGADRSVIDPLGKGGVVLCQLILTFHFQ